MAERKSPSPSPSKRFLKTGGGLGSRSVDLAGGDGMGAADDDNDEDDEETLQLKLQEIQAKLKLKKLQASRTQKKTVPSPDIELEHDPTLRPDSAPLGRRPQSRTTAPTRETIPRPKSQNAIEVPASPVRRTQPAEQVQKSPSRILLGIDKGLKAKDVSLKRAPSLRRGQQEKQSGQQQFGGYLAVSKPHGAASAVAEDTPRPLSFNERLAGARMEEMARKERQERIQQIRTTAFGVGKDEMEEYKSKAVDLPDIPDLPPTYTRDEILGISKPKAAGGLRRSNTAPSIRSRARPQRGSEEPEEAPELATEQARSTPPRKEDDKAADTAAEASFETYSGLHLSRRILPHPVVTRTVSGKKTYVLKDLLRLVKAPDFSLPDVESDVVVFGIIATKSEPRAHKPELGRDGKPKAQRGSYMVMTLADLQFDVELYLFKSGFDRYWKLSTGTVVAILNPTIMGPPRGREDAGRWGLVINSDADTILEIGTARDLGYCKSVRKDGSLCNTWVNAKRTEHCEFHTNEAVRRVRTSRNEVNMASFGGFGADGRRNPYKNSLAATEAVRYTAFSKESRERARGAQYDKDTQSQWFVSGGTRGAAALMDQEGTSLADQVEKREAAKRRIAANERESEIQRRLGERGGGAGRDYMRAAAATVSSRPSGSTTSGSRLGSSISSATLSTLSSSAALPAHHQQAPPPPRTADALGLARSRDALQIRLSPIKRKRPESSHSSSTATGGGASSSAGASTSRGGFGWGSNLKDKLARMKEGENLRPAAAGASASGGAGDDAKRGDRSPVRKKTRFVTEKGIREAGRESLGAELSAKTNRLRGAIAAAPDDEDEDELVIV